MARIKTAEPVAQKDTQPAAAIHHEPTHAEIQERAYYRYVERGRIDGFDNEDWYVAETELHGGKQPAVREPAPNRVPELTAPGEARSHAPGAKTGLLSA
jgi:hypothetical protein